MFNVEQFHRNRRGNFGKTLYYFENIDSTNLVAAQLATDHTAEGSVVLANQQSGGRGRKGSLWFSPRDLNLYFSLILRPEASRLHFMPFLTAMALIRSLQIVKVMGDLKWPNDILVSDKKISGILIETSTMENVLQFAIVGCGINVNSTDFPPELVATSTSIALETGSVISRESFLASFLLEFESLYEKITDMAWPELVNQIEGHSSYLHDCPVVVQHQGGIVEGITAGMDSYGGLLVRTPEGIETFYAAEVRSCRKK